MGMPLGLQLFLTFSVVFSLSLFGSVIFLKGFLLSRTVVDRSSECEAEFALRADDHHHHEIAGCWMHGRFRRAIIVIIDALKFEFMEYNHTLQNNDGGAPIPAFKNKLSSIDHLMNRRPQNSRLYKFMADPPTTTMQRLKGLTTGSLPTFVDAGANFHSTEILEDNIIDQLLKADKKIKFFGDDTWIKLFPRRFYKSYEYPSFDVKDLHTVDNGVLKNLYPEMRRRDWDIIIAHFLGVDHCGHRFGPNHPAMSDKLTQMDLVIRNITQLMRDDTVLFVMGDHGMTRTGDHGGDSFDELEAGLFIYSPAQLSSQKQTFEDGEDIVLQTDFVPSLSLLLGTPIPFSNLGMVIPELFSHCPWWKTDTNAIRRAYHRVKALRLNAQQINRYLSAYQEVSSDLPKEKMKTLKALVNQAEQDVQSLVTGMVADGMTSAGSDKFSAVENKYKSYIREARTMCEQVWAKFDLKLIVTGILTMMIGVALGVYLLLAWDESGDSLPVPAFFVLGGSILHLLYLAVHFSMFSDAVPPLMAWILAMVLLFTLFLTTKSVLKSQFKSVCNSLTVDNVVACVFLGLTCCVYFSNSFVVYEDSISLFCLVSMMFVFCSQIIGANCRSKLRNIENSKSEHVKVSKKSKQEFDFLQLLTQPSSLSFCILLCACLILRISSAFRSCREEQHLCEDSVFLFPLASVDESSMNQRYVFSVLCLAALVCAVRYWLKYYGNLNGSAPGVLSLQYAPPIAAVFISLHWALQALPHTAADLIPQWQQALLAQAVYLIVIVSLFALIIAPLLVYKLESRPNSSLHLPGQDLKQAIPTLYNQLKVRLNQDENEKPPVVYGLGSAYSASVVGLLMILSLLLCLLLGDGVAPAMLLATSVLYFFLELYSASLGSSSVEEEPAMNGPRWSGLVTLSLMSTVFFYATGHQATIASIRFESAYIGFYGEFNTVVLPGLVIWLNTFAGPVFFCIASPLLIFWPGLSTRVLFWMQGRTTATEQPWQGDFRLFNDATKLRKNIFRLSCGLVVIATLKMMFAACAATMHRRHLMVWKIFAPRFVYEAAMFVTTSVSVALVFLFVLRVDSALSKFVRELPTEKRSS